MTKKEIVLSLPKMKIPEFMKSEEFKNICCFFLLVWCITMAIMLVAGICEGNSDGRNATESCKDMSRIEYVLPGHQIGCWLGTKVE